MEKELREAVEFYNNWKAPEVRSCEEVNKHKKVLLHFAQSYLDVKGFPEEKCFFKRDFNGLRCYQQAKLREEAFNEALRLCKLVYLKDKPKKIGRDEIELLTNRKREG